jgi:peroxiredoxin
MTYYNLTIFTSKLSLMLIQNRQNSILFILLLLSQGCMHSEGSRSMEKQDIHVTTLSGMLEGGSGTSVLLEEMGARELIPIDTVTCDASGAFEINWSPTRIAFYQMRPGEEGSLTLLTEPGEQIIFQGAKGGGASYSISGSPGSELLRTLAKEHKKSLDALGIISRKNREQMSSPDYSVLKQQFDLQFDSITSGFHNYSTSFIKENAKSPAILIALYNLYGQGLPVFHPGADFPIYQFVDSVLMVGYSDMEAVQLLHAQVAEARGRMQNNRPLKQLEKGKIAPDFVSSRPDGSEMALSDLRGNYLLLGFWAGWSHTCREENASLVKAMERYGNLNFRILQVSVDDNRDLWENAIREDGLNWDHVSDLLRWETPVVDLYHVERIPYNVLLDPAGKIVASDLTGEQLLNTLDQILKQ